MSDEVIGTESESYSPEVVKELIEQNRPKTLLEVDKLTLELAKAQRQVALAEAKTALANNEKSEVQYKYIVLQLYMKYGLTSEDALNEAGEILYGGAKNVQ